MKSLVDAISTNERSKLLFTLIPYYVVTVGLFYILNLLAARNILLILFVVVPILLLTISLAWPVLKNQRLILNGRSANFFLAYCIVFSLLTDLPFVSGKRQTITGTETLTPKTLFGYNALEDWHYKLAPKAKPDHNSIVLALQETDPNNTRRGLIRILQKATAESAKLVVIDYHLKDPTTL